MPDDGRAISILIGVTRITRTLPEDIIVFLMGLIIIMTWPLTAYENSAIRNSARINMTFVIVQTSALFPTPVAFKYFSF